MLAAARRELTAAGISRSPDVVVADSGYWHFEQINEITGDGIPVLIPPDSHRGGGPLPAGASLTPPPAGPDGLKS
jgi:hypothetical protein